MRSATVVRRARGLPVRARTQTGMTLLETLMSMSLLTVIALLGAQALRITWQSWDLQDRCSDSLEHLTGLLRHVTRHLRMARNIVEVSDSSDTSGSLAVEMPDGSVVKWAHGGADQEVRYGIDEPTDLLATGIDSLVFTGFELDGVTPTTVPTDIRMIRVTAAVTLPVVGTPRVLSSTVWIRKQRDALAPPFHDFYARDSRRIRRWRNVWRLRGPPDRRESKGPSKASVDVFDFDTGALAGAVRAVLVGLLLRTDKPMGSDVLEVQLRRGPGLGEGPVHSFHEPALLRFEDNPDWFWVDVTDDYAAWTYDDIKETRALITNRDAGSGGSSIRINSVLLRSFETAPLTQTFWMTGQGTWNSEWRDRAQALGLPDGVYARSNLTFTGDVDRQAYRYSGSWRDLGTIIQVRLAVADLFLTGTFENDQFHARLPSVAEPQEPNDTPVPDTAENVSVAVLNQHVGSDKAATIYLDFTNLENWTWPGLNSHYVRLYATAVGSPDGAHIKVDGVGLSVRYVPPNEAAVVLWEEL